MRDLLTTALDVLGLLLLAAGIAALVYPFVGWAALAVAGVVVLSGSALSSWLTAPKSKR
jgi:hypothetical protein